MPHSHPGYCGKTAQHQNPTFNLNRVSCRRRRVRKRKKGGGDTVHSFDAATYIALTVALIHLCPEHSVEVFPLAAGFIQQPSNTITREYRRHAPGRPREQEQEQALQPFQKQHFPFFSKKWKGGGRENVCEQLPGGRCRLKIRIRTTR